MDKTSSPLSPTSGRQDGRHPTKMDATGAGLHPTSQGAAPEEAVSHHHQRWQKHSVSLSSMAITALDAATYMFCNMSHPSCMSRWGPCQLPLNTCWKHKLCYIFSNWTAIYYTVHQEVYTVFITLSTLRWTP